MDMKMGSCLCHQWHCFSIAPVPIAIIIKSTSSELSTQTHKKKKLTLNDNLNQFQQLDPTTQRIYAPKKKACLFKIIDLHSLISCLGLFYFCVLGFYFQILEEKMIKVFERVFFT